MQAVTTIVCQPISSWNEKEPEITLHGIVSCLKSLPVEQSLWERSTGSIWEGKVKNTKDWTHLLKCRHVSELVYPQLCFKSKERNKYFYSMTHLTLKQNPAHKVQ